MLTRRAALAMLWFGAAAALPAAAQNPQGPRECERCHGSREALLQLVSGTNPPASMVVTRAHLAGGPHGAVACADCHTGVSAFPHDTALARTVLCGRCHAAQDSLWRRGVHGPHAQGARAGCSDCHGGHDIARKGFLPTAAGREAMRAACVRCHPQQVATAEHDVHADTIACTRCHGTHDMRPVPDPATRFIDVRLARACSACHPKQANDYWHDIHGRTAAAQAAGARAIGDHPAATCISCHGEHGIRRIADPSWRFAVADACIGCHEDRGITFRDSYHGQASHVGSTRAAECADCHGAHGVLPSTDSASTVSDAHRVATCRGCHTGAQQGFVGYQPHANPTSRADNPLLFYVWLFMTSALCGTMVVWGTHTLLWYRRSREERRAHPNPKPAGGVALDAALRGPGPFVWRFTRFFRVIHAMIVASFFVLVLTGLPLRFSCTAWAPSLAGLLGSAKVAGLIHRSAGVIVFAYFAMYLGYVAARFIRSKERRAMFAGPDSIVFRLQDLHDMKAMVRWFFGAGPAPRFGRYNYMEKFDFFAEMWGVGAIGFSGLMLWQPVFFSRMFPGILFNVAIIIHSYEAMIATAFIFMIHFFNVHLRPHKFPLDAVMLHGRATFAYMEEEHGVLADRIRLGVLGTAPSAVAVVDAPAPPPSRTLSVLAAVSGLALLGVGMVLIGLILWGLLC